MPRNVWCFLCVLQEFYSYKTRSYQEVKSGQNTFKNLSLRLYWLHKRNFLTCYLQGLKCCYEELYFNDCLGRGLLSKFQTILLLFGYTCKQIVHGEKKLSPSGGQDNPDNDWQQLNKAPVWQRRIDTKHANKQQNLSCCMPPQMRQREKRSLTRCCPSKLVCKEKRRESSVTKWVWEIMQRQTVSVAGRGGGGEDVVTSDLKPRDGAC